MKGVSRSKCRFKSIFKVYVLKKIAYGADADAAAAAAAAIIMDAIRYYMRMCDVWYIYMENRY